MYEIVLRAFAMFSYPILMYCNSKCLTLLLLSNGHSLPQLPHVLWEAKLVDTVRGALPKAMGPGMGYG
jgi:hypothetical protein